MESDALEGSILNEIYRFLNDVPRSRSVQHASVPMRALLPHMQPHLAAPVSISSLRDDLHAHFDQHQFNAFGRSFAGDYYVIAVRLTRKLADMVDGIDLSAHRVGQVLHLPWRDAWLLIAEGWAELIERRRQPRTTHQPFLRRLA